MPIAGPDVDLGRVLDALDEGVSPVTRVPDRARTVSGVRIWTPGDPAPEDPAVLLACTGLAGTDPEGAAAALRPLLAARPSRVLVLCAAAAVTDRLDAADLDDHVLLAGEVDAVAVVTAVVAAAQTPDEVTGRRLAALQRSLSLALAEPDPVPDLLARLRRACHGNATAAVIDRRGEVVHATGPVPRSLLFDEISSTRAQVQRLGVDGWHGVAARIADPTAPEQHGGWLVVTSRRPGFPDPQVLAAVHVATSLLETGRRMSLLARQQERAIRAAVLEQALASRRERHDAELAARVAGLGLGFDGGARVVVAALGRPASADRRRQECEALADGLARAAAAAGFPALLTLRPDGATMLVQAGLEALRRLLDQPQDPLLQLGIGRPVAVVDGVVDSYHDAELAVQTLRRSGPDRRLMAYEDFDFATRLFADVGLDRMVSWAEDFLRPLAGRSNLVDGLRAYFAHDQNTNLAAEALRIHHNSLRYRLAKVEDLLGVDLKQPAAVSSVFLALTAVDLSHGPGEVIRPRPVEPVEPGTPAGGDGDSPAGPADFGGPERGGLGVVRGAER